MSPNPEHSSGRVGQILATDYDSFAEAYAAETESSLENGYYARPAILDLAGDVTGRRILDVGCGAGPLLVALRDRGADVTGIDPSAEMLALARRRLDDGTALHQIGLGGDPLPFPDAAQHVDGQVDVAGVPQHHGVEDQPDQAELIFLPAR